MCRRGGVELEFIKSETVYHYKIPQLEKLVLTGVLIQLLKDGEIKVEDKESKEILNNILNVLKKC